MVATKYLVVVFFTFKKHEIMEKGIEKAFLLCNGNEKQIEVGFFMLSAFDKHTSEIFVNSVKTFFDVTKNEVPMYKSSLVKKSSRGFNITFNLN